MEKGGSPSAHVLGANTSMHRLGHQQHILTLFNEAHRRSIAQFSGSIFHCDPVIARVCVIFQPEAGVNYPRQRYSHSDTYFQGMHDIRAVTTFT
jgi:hypothetical protein